MTSSEKRSSKQSERTKKTILNKRLSASFMQKGLAMCLLQIL